MAGTPFSGWKMAMRGLWSVTSVNRLPQRYRWHRFTPHTMDNASLSICAFSRDAKATGLSLPPRSGKCFSLVESNFPRGTTNQKHYPNLDSEASLVWNFCARFSDVIWRGKQWSVAKCWLFSKASCHQAWRLKEPHRCRLAKYHMQA